MNGIDSAAWRERSPLGGRVQSSFFQASILILGLGRVQEVEKFFDENWIPEAEKGINAGLEKLRIYQKLLDRISSEA